MQGNTWKKALAVLSGVAMIGAVGAVVAPANAAGVTCEADDWTSFEGCVNQANAGTVGLINVVNDLAHTSWNHPQGEYSTLNVYSDVTIQGNGHTISYVHFNVQQGADLTLEDTHIYDNAGSDLYHAEIPVFVGGGTADNPSTLNLNGQSSLRADNGSGRAYGIVAGSNSVVNLNSTPAQGTAAVRGSSAAVITLNNSDAEIDEHQPAEAVTNATINISAGDIVNENSQDDGVFAVNVNGADVNVTGTARVQEVYVKDGTFNQTGGQVWPNLDNVYGWVGSESSIQYPLVLDGTAQAFVSGGDLTGNYKDDQSGKGRAVLLRSADAKFNVRADAEVKLGGYDESAKNSGAAERVPGTTVTAGTGFAAPTQNGAGFSADYTSTGLSNSIDGSELRAFPAQDGEDKDTTFDLKSEATRGTAQNAASLTNSTVKDEKKVTADYSPLHGAQFVYAVGALQDEDSKIVTSTDASSIAHQVYVYGQPTFVGSYNYYDGTTGNPANGNDFPKVSANGLFAGWYDTEKLTTPVTTFPSNAPKYPFGYFVSNDTQNVLVQRNAGNGKTFTIRVLYGVPKADALTNYDFTVNLTNTDGTSYNFPLESTVYYSTATFGATDEVANRKTPSQSGFNLGDAQYFAAGYIYGVPEAWKNATVTVTPQWTTADGTEVSRGATTAVALPTTANDNQQVAYAE